MLRGLVYLALGAFGAAFSGAWGRRLVAGRRADPAQVRAPSPAHLGVGFATNFLDMLGIGSFATTSSAFKLLRLVPDQLIPGTLVVGHTWPTLAEAAISITIIKVEMATLVSLIAAAVLGSWLGGGVVARWPRRKIQVGMGLALAVVASVMAVRLLGGTPLGGEALGLSGAKLGVGLAGNFVFGALMNIGIGAFAPSLIMFGLLGMKTASIYPIMMGSCAFLMPVGGMQFVRQGSYSPRAALGLALGGVPGVLLAAYTIKELPTRVLSWLVVAIVVYTAGAMLRSATREAK